MVYICWFLASFLSATIQTVAGFGYAVTMMATLPLFVSNVQLVATVMTLSAFGVSGFAFLRFLKKIRLDLFIPLIITFIPIEILTAKIAVELDQNTVTMILGIVLVFLSSLSLVKKEKISFKRKYPAGIIFGIISGATAGFFAIGGPPMAIYYLGTTEDKEEYIASLALSFLITGISNAIIRFAMGLVTVQVINELGFAVIGLVFGCILGKKLFNKIPDTSFSKVTNIFIMVLGFWYIVRSVIL